MINNPNLVHLVQTSSRPRPDEGRASSPRHTPVEDGYGLDEVDDELTEPTRFVQLDEPQLKE